MRKLITILFLCLTIWLLGQSIELSPDSLIRKYHIKTITSYFSNDSIKNELKFIWKFDRNGNIVSKELFDLADPTISKDLYFYKDNLIEEHWKIGTWTKYDTLRTTYHYDTKLRLIKMVTNGKFGLFNTKVKDLNNSATYRHINDTISIISYEGNSLSAREAGSDSIVYNTKKSLKYLYNKTNDLKYSYYYNGQGQLVLKTQSSITDPKDVRRSNKFIYKKGLLVKEIESVTDFENRNKIYKSEYLYINNSQGLLEKLQRPFNYDIYKYEFY